MGINQMQLGQLLEMPQSNISAIETGRRPFPKERLATLRRLLEAPADRLDSLGRALREGDFALARSLLREEP